MGVETFNPSVGTARMQRSAYERLVRKVKAAAEPPAVGCGPWKRSSSEKVPGS